MKKKYCDSDILLWKVILVIMALCLAISVEAGERLHWYIQQGKGRPLCESLTRIANNNQTLASIIPNIPWKEVLSIKGVREPEWKELDPLQYEDFFLKARKFIASEKTYDEQVISFARWFLPPKERWVDKSARNKPISDEDALKIYRDFVRRGGKLNVFRCDIGDEKHQMLRDFVQYESPEKDFSDWDGYSLQAEPDLTGIHEAGYPITELGEGYRLLIYKNDLFSFVGFRRGYDEYDVKQMCGSRAVEDNEDAPYYLETYYCKINSEVIKRRNKNEYYMEQYICR